MSMWTKRHYTGSYRNTLQMKFSINIYETALALSHLHNVQLKLLAYLIDNMFLYSLVAYYDDRADMNSRFTITNSIILYA